MRVNLNRMCLIRELPRGVAAFNEYYRTLHLPPEQYRRMAMQSDGRLKMQLWQVCNIYGGEMFMGPEPPIETELELCD